LSEGCDHIEQHLANLDAKGLTFFNRRQVEEEILKAKLVMKNPEWGDSLRNYETHDYFYGQIGFLLELARDDSLPDGYCLQTFNRYATRASNLFSNPILNSKEFLLERALLTCGNYLIPRGNQNKSFCLPKTGNARDRNENWRTVFNKELKLEKLKQLLDQLSDSEPVSETLQTIITNYSDKASWRGYLVKNTKLITCCGERNIRFWEDGRILLIQGTNATTYAELHSYHLYCQLKDKRFAAQYHKRHGENEVPYFCVQAADNLPWKLRVEFKGKWNGFMALSVAPEAMHEEHANILRSKGFQENCEMLELENLSTEEAFLIIENISNSLNQLVNETEV
jgi:hypothetical protein